MCILRTNMLGYLVCCFFTLTICLCYLLLHQNNFKTWWVMTTNHLGFFLWFCGWGIWTGHRRMTSSCCTVFRAAARMPHVTQRGGFTHGWYLVLLRGPVPPSACSSPRASPCGLSCQQCSLDFVHVAQGSRSTQGAAGLFNTWAQRS